MKNRNYFVPLFCSLSIFFTTIIFTGFVYVSPHTVSAQVQSHTPVVTLVSPANNSIESTHPVDLLFSVTDTKETVIVCNLYMNMYGTLIGPQMLFDIPADGSIQRADSMASFVGDLSWWISCTDIKGNTGTTPHWSVTIDSQGPRFDFNTLIYPNGGADQVFGLGNEVNIRWNSSSISDQGAGLDENPIDLYYSLDNGLSWISIIKKELNDGSYIWTVPANINSTRAMIRLSARDKAGNSSSVQSSSTFTIYSIPPVIKSIDYSTNLGGDQTLISQSSGIFDLGTIGYSKDKITSLHIHITDPALNTSAIGPVIWDNNTLTAVYNKVQDSFDLLPAEKIFTIGIHSVSLTFTGKAQNKTTITLSINVIDDTTPPPAPSQPTLANASDSGVSSNDNLTNITTPEIAINNPVENSGYTIQIVQDETNITPVIDNKPTWTSPKLIEGTHTIVVRAVNKTGSKQTDSQKLNITIDTTPPVVEAGKDIISYPFITNTLSGKLSDLNGIASYLWTKLTGPGEIFFSSPDTSETKISIDTEGSYLIKLLSTDNAGNSRDDTLNVLIKKPGDINNDGRVDIVDLSILISNWYVLSDPSIDINFDEQIDALDLAYVTQNWSY